MSRIDDFEEMLDGYEGREQIKSPFFNIKDFVSFYRIDGIYYNHDFISCHVVTELLPGQRYGEHVIHAINALDSEYRAASAPLVYAICRTLYQNKEGPHDELVENARTALENLIGKTTIITLSEAIYNPDGLFDHARHYTLQKKVKNSKPARLKGNHGLLTDPKTTEATDYVQAIFDTEDDVETVNDVFKWITGKDSYVLRAQNMPKDPKGFAVTLGVMDMRSDFMICSAISADKIQECAFGVRPVLELPENEGMTK